MPEKKRKTYEERLAELAPPRDTTWDHPAKAALAGAGLRYRDVMAVCGVAEANVRQMLGGWKPVSPKVRAAISWLLAEAGWSEKRIDALFVDAPRRPGYEGRRPARGQHGGE